ncbi:hypothetical protein IIC65_09765, partial [Candidatus Sumerlaeota bacterium]|nr:hypothetical protein [Candidatus Sumerlaeota bacterium]
MVLSPKRTLPTAQAFVREFHYRCGREAILIHAGVSLAWQGSCWVPVEDGAIRQRLQPWLHEAVRYVYSRASDEMELVPFESNPRSVNAALDTIKSLVHISENTPVPSWLEKRSDQPPAVELLPCSSFLLHLPTMRRIPPTPT